jgi:hypothetical protein
MAHTCCAVGRDEILAVQADNEIAAYRSGRSRQGLRSSPAENKQYHSAQVIRDVRGPCRFRVQFKVEGCIKLTNASIAIRSGMDYGR